jgi:hypothetical protein
MEQTFRRETALVFCAVITFIALTGISCTAIKKSGSVPVANAAADRVLRDPIWKGVYTRQQSTRGQIVYDSKCGPGCHQADLMGDLESCTPPLVSEVFLQRWSDRSVADLYNMIADTMPAGAPSSLTSREYLDIVSYILQSNKFPSGNSELPLNDDALKTLVIHESPRR